MMSSRPRFLPSPLRPLAGGVVLGLSVLAVSGCSSEAAPSKPPRPVLVMTVGSGQATQDPSRTVAGVVVARYASELGFQVPGRIGARLVEVGQSVRKGQPLLRLDSSDYTLALTAARAEAEQATADSSRFAALVAEGAVSQADNDRVQARARAVRAQFELAANRVRYATLSAPYDGVITAVRAEAGQVVGEGMPVVSVARPGEIEIAADIPEALVADVASLPAQAEVWGAGGAPFAVRLREVAPTASQPLRTYPARFSLSGLTADARQRLHLGMTAQLRFAAVPSKTMPGERVVLPASALSKAAQGAFVWVLPAGKDRLQQQPVQVLSHGNDTVTVNGLADGARVVIAGVQKLDGGMRVRAVERSGAGLDLAARAR